jgi:hypothetical protein
MLAPPARACRDPVCSTARRRVMYLRSGDCERRVWSGFYIAEGST